MARQRFAGRPGMVKTWGGLEIPETALSVVQGAIATFTLSTDFGETVLRFRGEVLIQVVPDAAGDETVVGLGITVVHANAAAAGGASLPGPMADIEADWLWHQFVPLRSIAATAASDVGLGLQARVVIDSKAMRKVEKDEVVVFMAELGTTTVASAVILGGLRILSGLTR